MLNLRPVAVLAALALGLLPARQAAALPGTACPMFPADNVWNANISNLPVNTALTASVQSLFNSGGAAKLHPDFGPPTYGMPFNVVTSGHQMAWKPPRTPSISFQYASESDSGPYPAGSDIQIEGQYGDGGDDHALSVVGDTCTLSEVWHAQLANTPYSGGSGATWNLRSDALRPNGWTSADAAGLPILPGLVRYDEIRAGVIAHALRFTLSQTAQSHVWPARHDAGSGGAGLPPMGTRFRLKAGFNIAGYPSDAQVVLRAMQRYGMFLADNGSNWYFQGTRDSNWTYAFVDSLKTVPASAFEVVNESSLMVDPNSGAVRGSPPAPSPTPKHTAAPSPAAAHPPSPAASPSAASPSPGAGSVPPASPNVHQDPKVPLARPAAAPRRGWLPLVAVLVLLLLAGAGYVALRIRRKRVPAA